MTVCLGVDHRPDRYHEWRCLVRRSVPLSQAHPILSHIGPPSFSSSLSLLPLLFPFYAHPTYPSKVRSRQNKEMGLCIVVLLIACRNHQHSKINSFVMVSVGCSLHTHTHTTPYFRTQTLRPTHPNFPAPTPPT